LLSTSATQDWLSRPQCIAAQSWQPGFNPESWSSRLLFLPAQSLQDRPRPFQLSHTRSCRARPLSMRSAADHRNITTTTTRVGKLPPIFPANSKNCSKNQRRNSAFRLPVSSEQAYVASLIRITVIRCEAKIHHITIQSQPKSAAKKRNSH